MDAAEFKNYLDHRYYDQIHYYEAKSGINQKKYKNFQWTLIILSTITTIVAALAPQRKSSDEPGLLSYLPYVVVVTSAIVTIISSALKTFQYQELWVNYRTTIEQLKPEIWYYTFELSEFGYGQPGMDKESHFVSRVENILTKESRDKWPVAKKIKDQPDPGQIPAGQLQKNPEDLIRERVNTQKGNELQNPSVAGQSNKPA
jgi:hypothetical protein